ncbi:MAG: GNAT family N-acetyltransferase [Bacillota bacterium]|uniref:GNAT family N-acetyltransferase n=1 Tax=unclassified Virgibacillus TaxID=2620237 RepID=UPI000EF4C17C|nr:MULTISPECIES: GNAT family N-acetyltransferase [unclassified Virgibacillus]MDY7043085.1 GNAT family N-acetyltransferase [Virgibacillus sp. M23]
MNIRSIEGSDYYRISPIINEWWGGRQMADMVPKLFFEHFNNSSFIAEENGKIIGFLIGFVSQSQTNTAYIHFIGVHPNHRNMQIGKRLYHTFFQVMKRFNVEVIRCVTSPKNRNSIAFHTHMGFDIVEGDNVVDGISIHTQYDGINHDRVLFRKQI